MRARTAFLPAAVVLALATPVATWWLVGDRSEEVPPDTDLDYTFQPFPIDPVVERVAGVVSVVLAGLTGLLLMLATVRGRLDRRWWSVLGPVLVAGAVLGEAWRVMTAGVQGFNFGAGFAVMLGGPLAVALVLYAGFRCWQLLRSRADN